MNDAQLILNAYHASDDRGKLSILEYAVSTAEDWPAARVELLPVDPGALASGELVDLEAPAIIRPPIEI